MGAPIDLNLLRSFAAVHAKGSFSAAALELGVPRSTVSRAVLALEEELGQQLFQRTTRRVTTTRVGLSLFDRVAPQLESLASAFRDLPEAGEEPSGLLRITATADLGSMVLAEAATRFTQRYPRAEIEIALTDRVVDLVREGFDLALRLTANKPKSSSLIARKVGTVVLQLYAAPSYLARRSAPRSPAAVAEHDWVSYTTLPIALTSAGARRVVHVTPRLRGNDMFFVREALKAGAGLGVLPTFVADTAVTSGELVRVLPDWVVFSSKVLLVRPAHRQASPKVQSFQELLLELLRQRPISNVR
jgi:DNA-binding transcriptional LysR family regulator